MQPWLSCKQDICRPYSALICVILISKAFRLACVNEGSHRFTCHPHVYPHMEWAILPLLPSRRASPQFGRYISRPAEGRRLSWPRWVGEILRWFALSMPVTHPVLAAAAGNRTRDHRVASLTGGLPRAASQLVTCDELTERFCRDNWHIVLIVRRVIRHCSIYSVVC